MDVHKQTYGAPSDNHLISSCTEDMLSALAGDQDLLRGKLKMGINIFSSELDKGISAARAYLLAAPKVREDVRALAVQIKLLEKQATQLSNTLSEINKSEPKGLIPSELLKLEATSGFKTKKAWDSTAYNLSILIQTADKLSGALKLMAPKGRPNHLKGLQKYITAIAKLYEFTTEKKFTAYPNHESHDDKFLTEGQNFAFRSMNAIYWDAFRYKQKGIEMPKYTRQNFLNVCSYVAKKKN